MFNTYASLSLWILNMSPGTVFSISQTNFVLSTHTNKSVGFTLDTVDISGGKIPDN
jgi:hypothetical protein